MILFGCIIFLEKDLYFGYYILIGIHFFNNLKRFENTWNSFHLASIHKLILYTALEELGDS
ncbi:hypothetical protein BpHYR1_047916 [Brachionus plicatilis]|uniref:Uncharacterized protein n=1 Tax=Brachionus plicatilis TaxID=10195 RepID=A0A3M7SZ02_BRAPC|nr:hypothetical protein BpHYR1_047916 [Brachionus plicatilis]